jgi:hypothetical protein
MIKPFYYQLTNTIKWNSYPLLCQNEDAINDLLCNKEYLMDAVKHIDNQIIELQS